MGCVVWQLTGNRKCRVGGGWWVMKSIVEWRLSRGLQCERWNTQRFIRWLAQSSGEELREPVENPLHVHTDKSRAPRNINPKSRSSTSKDQKQGQRQRRPESTKSRQTESQVPTVLIQKGGPETGWDQIQNIKNSQSFRGSGRSSQGRRQV